MLKFYFLLVIGICHFFSCGSLTIEKDNASCKNGVYFEDISEEEQYHSLYTSDNRIYTLGKSFIYSYEYFDKNGVPYFFKLKDQFSQDWTLVLTNSLSSKIITKIELSVVPRPKNQDSTYQQTNILYHLIDVVGNRFGLSGTGLVENNKNIWLHPPRQHLFKILQLNPYPFIQKPYVEGNSYDWDLDIGSLWRDHRWATWNGLITNHQEYHISETENLQTNFGEIKCLKIIATGTSELGNTHLTAYFNDSLGFLKLDYINIDSSRMALILKDIIDNSDQSGVN